MTMRRRLAQVTDLHRLQRAERDLAALDHADACARADAARDAADQAAARAGALAEQWYARRALPHFEPELDAATAGILIMAERRSIGEAVVAAEADAERDDRAGAWRLTDARQRATERIVRDTRRAIARTDDEARLEAASARALDRWSRT